uniref:Putative ixodes 26 kDa salivary protein n=1 Tax=Ixodes ricinus TaxID=34613 RepID=A0A0K8RFW8_IXORI
MKAFIAALQITLFAFCFATVEGLKEFYLNKGSAEKTITIAFALAGFPPDQVNLNSDVGQWVQGASEEAQKLLSKQLNMNIKLDITDMLSAPQKLSDEIKRRTTHGQMHGRWIVNAPKDAYKNSFNPDIICVVTKFKFYYNRKSNALGYSYDKTLCEDMVPILLTYNFDTEDDTPEAGKLLSNLIKKSIKKEKLKSAQSKEALFDNCNIRHKSSFDYDDDDDDSFYVLPLDKDLYYGN